jgi:hypothetical protein
MTTRGTIIAVLLVIELAIIGAAGVALHAGQPTSSSAQRTRAHAAAGPHLAEGGAHQIFDASAHPTLTVDIGYADLTILTSKAPHIDVSLSASTAYGAFREKAPLTARGDGETVAITTTERRGWSVGDDRMVTVVVPPETRVTVVRAGDIRANGLRAEASFNSIGAGSVTVEDYDAPSLRVAASNGRISMHQIVAARIDATSRDGRVEGTALQVRDGNVESNGPVTLGFVAGADTLVTAATSNGRVSATGFGAGASVASVRKAGEDGAASWSTQTVRVGAGDGRLDVHSSDGNINLAQEG